MSLRRRLVVGMLLLLVAGFITIDLVTSSSLRSFLIGRLDEQIDASQNQTYSYISQVYQRDLKAGDRTPVTHPGKWLTELNTKAPVRFTGVPAPDPRLNGSVLAARLSSDAYVEVLSSSGAVIARVPSGLAGNPDPAPVLPRVLPVQRVTAPHVFGTNHGPYSPESRSIDVAAVGSQGLQYRLQAVAVPGGTLVTAISLDPTDKTLASLTHVELFVSIVVIIALLLLALWIVRLGLRPLDDMTETAGAIAGGDLTRRIRRADDRSEVGRLGSALNGMLSQIEAAFRERTSSEDRLRRFVADASHELRTPLTSVRGYAELLRKGAFDTEDERRRAAERIEGEAARMSLLVEDLLLLARLDQGRPLTREPVDLCQVVAHAVDSIRINNTGRPITLDQDGSIVVQGDAARLRQIVDNLLQNAVVHTPPATPVHVKVGRDGPNAVVQVADEGPGLEAEQAVHVFDRFYRGNESRTGEGTGLGLSIVAALAAAHGGSARVDTAPRAGSVFLVEIPLTDAVSETATVSETDVPDSSGGADDEHLAPSVRR
ncbi:MAG TPA: HAMP domain-containing sensor histidine kinase [Acidimicrobiales bacterium]|nr:HAMP domain-containing sensor histidine kinase [Acidimicrobiales bacterium]